MIFLSHVCKDLVFVNDLILLAWGFILILTSIPEQTNYIRGHRLPIDFLATSQIYCPHGAHEFIGIGLDIGILWESNMIL
jgi:hypothetical protein